MLKRAGEIVLMVALATTSAHADTPTNGDDILARSAAAAGLQSYAVPIHFDVHMHRPVGVKAGVEGMAYFEAPASAALVITKAPSVIGGFFKGSYPLDMAPQTWPAKYHVETFTTAQSGGRDVYVLQSVPKTPGDIDRVIFTVAQADFAPVSAEWQYHDKSKIALSIVNQVVSGANLPKSESIVVSMPKYALDANGTYGQYALNAAVPSSVFKR